MEDVDVAVVVDVDVDVDLALRAARLTSHAAVSRTLNSVVVATESCPKGTLGAVVASSVNAAMVDVDASVVDVIVMVVPVDVVLDHVSVPSRPLTGCEAAMA